MNHIFDRFYRAKEVRAGGTLSAENLPKGAENPSGAIFCLRLPTHQQGRAQDPLLPTRLHMLEETLHPSLFGGRFGTAGVG